MVKSFARLAGGVVGACLLALPLAGCGGQPEGNPPEVQKSYEAQSKKMQNYDPTAPGSGSGYPGTKKQ
jgi:hypothetical protein